jgi:hypothetical protein
MITIPAGWQHHHGAHLVSLYPPAGGGRIRFYERLPIERASATLSRILAGDDAFRITSVGQPTPFVTSEGEHGLFVALRGIHDHAPVSRSVAIVFTDEFAAALDTLIVAPERAEELERKTRELMVKVSFGLNIRRRRFFYDPPPGWFAIPSGLVATWHPPGYPRDACSLVVHPATPRLNLYATDLDTPATHEELVADLVEHGPIQTTAIDVTGFEARRFAVAGKVPGGRAIVREVILLLRRPYLYGFRLDLADRDRHAELAELLLGVAASSQPVPEASDRQVTIGAGSSLDHWVD